MHYSIEPRFNKSMPMRSLTMFLSHNQLIDYDQHKFSQTVVTVDDTSPHHWPIRDRSIVSIASCISFMYNTFLAFCLNIFVDVKSTKKINRHWKQLQLFSLKQDLYQSKSLMDITIFIKQLFLLIQYPTKIFDCPYFT